MAECSYSSPIFVGNNPRFPYARRGYLPSYCPACPERFSCEEYQPKPVPEPVFRPRPVDAEIDRLKGEVNYLLQKVTELQARKKTKNDYEPF